MNEKNKKRKYYNSNGITMTFEDFVKIEIEERGNYTREDLLVWLEKYSLKLNSVIIWVTSDKWIAHSYNLSASEREFIRDVSEDALVFVEFTEEDGFIIPETDDGENGFIMVLNKG